MILVTGGTGFVGRALIRHLTVDGYPVRTLLRPSDDSPHLPLGVSVEVAISSLNNERNLRAALIGVETIYHLVGGEWQGTSGNLFKTEVQGIQTLIKAAQESGVKRIFYISHIGADRASAYPVLKVKGIVEEFIRKSGIDYTIIRSGLIYGPGDNFSTKLAELMSMIPIIFPLPSRGEVLLQPVFIEDVVTSLVWALESKDFRNKIFTIGGPEIISIQEIAEETLKAAGIRRRIVYVTPSYLRILMIFVEYIFPGLPWSIYWLDYLSANRTTSLDSLSRQFGLLPVRFSKQLNYLKEINWRRSAFRSLFKQT